MQPGAIGELDMSLSVGQADATQGGIPGDIPAGRWRAQIDVERTTSDADYLLEVEAEFGEPQASTPLNYPADRIIRAEPGWYRGELHAHSTESDGRAPVSSVLRAAHLLGLDFLALTDHFTTSGFRFLAQNQEPNLAVIRSIELTGHSGHANIHGIQRWHDIFIDGRGDWDINQLAREVRTAGGLFCVNHPFSPELGWRYQEFDWDLADMLEVWHAFEGPGNLLAIGLWDEQLRNGRRILGVAATDSHDPTYGKHRLGQVFTAIYAPELSEAGLIAGLRSGRVYGTRGPHLELSAQSSATPNNPVWMGGTIAAGVVKLSIEIDQLAFPWHLHVIKNGYPHTIFTGAAGPQRLQLHDDAQPNDYYRIELHANPINADGAAQRWRDWTSLLAFSNPIFVV
jgi:hypothetical protein